MDLQITEQDDSTLIVALRGRFDAFNATSVKASWQNNEGLRFIIMDLSETTFLESVALAILVQGLKTSRLRGGNFIIANPSEAARTIFELTAMDRAFTITLSVEDALDLVVTL